MPDTFENLSVRIYRDGKAGYILFELLDSFATSLMDMPCRINLEYEYGYASLGFGEGYTLRMLAHARLIDGTICHQTTNSPESFRNALAVDRIDPPPVKIQEDGGRGTSINATVDQAILLRYWAWARRSIAVGLALSVNSYTIEYWFDFMLEPIPDDDDGRVYHEILRRLWLAKMAKLSPRIAIECDNLGQDFSFSMRYQGNALKVWFTPTARIQAGLTQPLAEALCPKDKWVSKEGFVLFYPPMPD
jgi:hypothetical protein